MTWLKSLIGPSLKAIDNRDAAQQARLDEFLDVFTYEGDATCAADGMCQVGIDV
jgi:D-lactate dehydrogenase